MLADLEIWNQAFRADDEGHPEQLSGLIAHGDVPIQIRERLALRIATTSRKPERRPSLRIMRLADAVQEHRRLVAGGMTLNDALKQVCEVYGLEESVLDNAAIKRTRNDVNKELARRECSVRTKRPELNLVSRW